jgi:hypothetical protein
MTIVSDYINGVFGDASGGQEVGIGGFTTLSRVSERVARTRDVPTTYLEDGSHINDHIIRNPLQIFIEGVVGDTFVLPSPLARALTDASADIGVITQYAQGRTATELQSIVALSNDVFTTVNQIDVIVESTQSFGNVGFTGTKSNIEKFIDAMEGIHNSDSLIVIDAPGRTYENMVITSIDYDRDNTSKVLNFRIEAQQFRFAETGFAEVQQVAKNPASATNGQTAGAADKGPQEGDPVEEQEESFFYSTFGFGG